MITTAEETKKWVKDNVEVKNLNFRLEVFERTDFFKATLVELRAEFWFKVKTAGEEDRVVGAHNIGELRLPVTEDIMKSRITHLVDCVFREVARQMVVIS